MRSRKDRIGGRRLRRAVRELGVREGGMKRKSLRNREKANQQCRMIVRAGGGRGYGWGSRRTEWRERGKKTREGGAGGREVLFGIERVLAVMAAACPAQPGRTRE